MRLISKYLQQTRILKKDEVSQNRLAVDYVKLGFERNRFYIAFAGAIFTVIGIGFGIFQFIENQNQAIEQQKLQSERFEAQQDANLETQLALRFFDLKAQEDRAAYIENLERFPTDLNRLGIPIRSKG